MRQHHPFIAPGGLGAYVGPSSASSEASRKLIPNGIWPPGGRHHERGGGLPLFGPFRLICLDMYVGSWGAAPKELSHVELMLA